MAEHDWKTVVGQGPEEEFDLLYPRIPIERIFRSIQCSDISILKRRPYGTPTIRGGTAHPTLKRGANQRCAYGAGLVGMPSCVDRDAELS